jgi:hypothetical protein
MLLGLGAVWQSFLGVAVFDVLGKIRIPGPALTSLVTFKDIFQAKQFCYVRNNKSSHGHACWVAGDFRVIHWITNTGPRPL